MNAPRVCLRGQLDALVQLRQSMAPLPTRFCCMEDLVLRYGIEYQHRATVHQVRPRECFRQSYRLATRARSAWVYVEGFALSAFGLAVQHAWVTRVDAPGSAFELAWADADVDTAYLGIPIRADYIREVFRAGHRRNYSVLDAWWLRHPLLTGATPIESVVHEQSYTGPGAQQANTEQEKDQKRQ